MDARRTRGGIVRDGSAPAPSMNRLTGESRAFEAQSLSSCRLARPEERTRTLTARRAERRPAAIRKARSMPDSVTGHNALSTNTL